ncbi:MAG: hypothetical protein KDA89_24750, partial [Planctomycetaceae bacterium]|nr:hypothetical protein [Planctomycetaceae bacterium]
MTESVLEKYFRSQMSSLYRWADDGRELCWLDGTTIAFHEELAVVLEQLAGGTLPKFSAVVVSMAAMRSSWPEVSGRITRIVRALQESSIPSYATAMAKHAFLTDTWPDSANRLTLLSRFAQQSATTPAQRAELAASLFSRFESGFSAKIQQYIAAAFRAGLPSDWTVPGSGDGEPITFPATDEEEQEWRTRPPLFHRILHDVLELLRIARMLASGLHDYSVADLRQQVRTGVATEIKAAEAEVLPDALSARQFLHSLRGDAEHGGFARLTQQLIAAVTLPQHPTPAGDSASGGFADISNRGEPDRLLLSELVHDDFTLAIRIANNEAMYLRREPPPAPKARSRPVLIDNSLPMWGLPKIYAASLALALQAGSDRFTTVSCFRPSGTDVERVSLNTRDNLTEQLAAISPSEHPGRCLEAFAELINDDDSGETAEPVIITTEDVLENHEFRHAVNQQKFTGLWIAAVERDGRLALRLMTRQG